MLATHLRTIALAVVDPSPIVVAAGDDIYFVPFDAGKGQYGAPHNLGANVSTKRQEQMHLYATQVTDGTWSAP